MIMKQTVFSNWSLMRFLRLAMGIAILVQAVIAKDMLFAFAGIIFTAMPVFNVGCCGTAGCAATPVKDSDTTQKITYEEVV
jgi:hypothetical protein